MTNTPASPETPATPQAEAPRAAVVRFTGDDAVRIATTIGGLINALNPLAAGTVALATGGIEFIRGTILPAIQHLGEHELSVVEQAAEKAEADADRLRVGAAPDPIT